jgi:accessory gene regulator B
MFFIERLSKDIVSTIYNTSDIDKDEMDIIEYGVLILILKLIGILMIIIFGAIFGVLIQSLVFYFTTCILRKYSGGIHSESPNRCIIIGTFVSVFVSLCINKFYTLLQFDLVIFLEILILIFCYYIILKYAPIDSIAKPITDMKKRKQLKKKSILVIVSISILLFVLIEFYLSYRYKILLKLSYCICFALLWQCFTLTIIGHTIMRKVDNILKYIIRR